MSGLVGSLVMELSQIVDTILSVDKRICVKVIAVADGPAVRHIKVQSSTGTPRLLPSPLDSATQRAIKHA